MYLSTHIPYLDSSLFVVNLRIQSGLICWANHPSDHSDQTQYSFFLSIYIPSPFAGTQKYPVLHRVTIKNYI